MQFTIPVQADAGPNGIPVRGAECKTLMRGPSEQWFYDIVVFSQSCYGRGRAQIFSAAVTRELSTFANVREEICYFWRKWFVGNGVSTEFPSASCIWQKWIIYTNTTVRTPRMAGPYATASVALAKGRPWKLITNWVSNNEMHTSGLHNSESSQDKIDQHRFDGRKCLFRCSVEAFLKHN